MKFHQLRVGAFFEYHGTRYRKNAPLTAVNEADGKQRLIPRSASVTPLDSTAARAPEPVLPDSLPTAALVAALDALVQASGAALQGEPTLSEARRAQLLDKLHRARDDILTRLALQGGIGE